MGSRFNFSANNKSLNFGEWLAIFFLGCMLCLAFFLVWFWFALTNYESKTPEASLAHINKLIQKSDYQALFLAGDYPITTLNTEQDYLAYLQLLFPQDIGTVEFIKKTKLENNTLIYNALVKNSVICQIELTPIKEQALAYHSKIIVLPNKTIQITAPQFANVLINGNPIDPTYCKEEQIYVDEFDDISQDIRPQVVNYTIENLLSVPKITASIPDQICNVTETNPGVFSISCDPSGESLQAFENHISTVASLYAPFTSGDKSFTELRTYLVPDTGFFKATHGYDSSWVVEHESYTIEDLKVFNIQQLSDTAFSGEIKFTYNINLGNKIHPYPTHYKMTFVSVDNQWKLLTMRTY